MIVLTDIIRKIKTGIVALLGLTIVTIVVLNHISKSLHIPIQVPDDLLIAKSRFASHNRTASFTNLQNGAAFNEEFLRELYVEKPYASDEKNKQLLLLTEKGQFFFAFSRSNHADLWSKEPYLSRRIELQHRCRKLLWENIIDLTRFVYDDKNKMIMCVVPKTGCTSWKRFIAYFNGLVDKDQIEEMDTIKLELGDGELKHMSNLSKLEVLRRFATYTSSFVERHPFERLVSAHSNKFSNSTERKSTYYQDEIGKAIALLHAEETLKGLKYEYNKAAGASLVKDKAFMELDHTEQDAALHYIDVMNTGFISFHHFVEYIASTHEDPYSIDVHWRPQTTLCNPCVLNFDFAVKFHNLAKDSNVLLEYVQHGRPDHEKVFFNSSRTPQINMRKTFEAFQGLDPKTMLRLKEIYANDFKVFGYPLSWAYSP